MANGLDPPERPVDLPFVATLRAVADEYVRAPLDRPMLATVVVPVLLVVGGASTPRMRVITEELSQFLSRSVVVEIPRAHHFNLWRVGAHRFAHAWVEHCLGVSFLEESPNRVAADEQSGADLPVPEPRLALLQGSPAIYAGRRSATRGRPTSGHVRQRHGLGERGMLSYSRPRVSSLRRNPPSIGMQAPVMYAAAGEAR